MESTKISALLVLAMLALSSPMALACGSSSCTTPSTGTPSSGTGISIPNLPIGIPSVTPIIGGAVPTVGGVAGGAVPTVGGVAGGAVPTVGGVAGGAVPTVGGVVGIIAPIIGGGSPSPKRHGGRKACPPSPSTPTPAPTPPTPTPSPTTPSSSDKCPIDALKLGVCLDILGNDVHIGDSRVKCCPLVQGVAGLTAAACLCTAIKAKVLDLSVYVPLALKLLVNDCGCAVPPGFTCA